MDEYRVTYEMTVWMFIESESEEEAKSIAEEQFNERYIRCKSFISPVKSMASNSGFVSINIVDPTLRPDYHCPEWEERN